ALRHGPRPRLFPYTTLFRSSALVLTLNTAVATSATRSEMVAVAIPVAGNVPETQAPEAIGLPRVVESMVAEVGRSMHTCAAPLVDRKSTRLNSSHLGISYAV